MEIVEIDISTLQNVDQKLLTLIRKLDLDNKRFPIVAGGAARRLLTGEDCWNYTKQTSYLHGDIDIFFRTRQQYDEFVGRNDYNFAVKRRKKFQNAYNIIGVDHSLSCTIKYQAIYRRYYPNIKALFADFDISISKVATDGYTVYTTKETLEDLHSNIMRFSHIQTPINSVARLAKYCAIGYTPEPGMVEYIINNMDRSDRGRCGY